MGRTKDGLRIEIKEATAETLRTIQVTITAPVEDFKLTDVLRERGAFDGLDVTLRQAIKESIQAYTEDAESLIAELSNGRSKSGKRNSLRAKTGSLEEQKTAINGTEPERLEQPNTGT
jgi:hypothetical protein